jgi:NlpC/P60 family putative phage cell wall peptidase
MTEAVARAEIPEHGRAIVEIARSWIGTPYEHQASCAGAGADCLGLLRGIWRACYGAEPEKVPAYTPDWAEPSGEEVLFDAARRHMDLVAPGESRPGDAVVMRMRTGGIAKHLGILARDRAESWTLIHAYSGHGVVESPLTPAWSRRIVGTFRFPYRSR